MPTALDKAFSPDKPAQASTPAPDNVVEALIEVMREVSHVAKLDRNDQQHFNFRGIDAVVNAVGPALRKVGVVILPQLVKRKQEVMEVGKNNTAMVFTEVTVRYTALYSPTVNAFGGDPIMLPGTGIAVVSRNMLSTEVVGEAFDSGDKGTAKAMSVAYRIFLLQLLTLPTTEPDPDATSHQLASSETPRNKAERAKYDDVIDVETATNVVKELVEEGLPMLGSMDEGRELWQRLGKIGVQTDKAIVKLLNWNGATGREVGKHVQERIAELNNPDAEAAATKALQDAGLVSPEQSAGAQYDRENEYAKAMNMTIEEARADLARIAADEAKDGSDGK